MADPFNVERQAFLEQVAADSDALPSLATPLAVFVARYVNRDTGDAWPAISTLAAHVRKGERTVQRTLRAMADRGHISITEGGGRKHTNRYRWIIKPTEKGVAVDTLSERNPVRSDTVSDENPVLIDTLFEGETVSFSDERVSFSSRNPVQNDTRTSEEPLKEPLKEKIPPTPRQSAGRKGADSTDAEFEAWWSGYPRKDAKGAARKAYASARKKASAEELIIGRDRYAGRRRHEDPKFTKHGATWLNSECWNDEPTPAHVLPPGSEAGTGARSVGVGGRAAPFSATAYLARRYTAQTETSRRMQEFDASFSTIDGEVRQ